MTWRYTHCSLNSSTGLNPLLPLERSSWRRFGYIRRFGGQSQYLGRLQDVSDLLLIARVLAFLKDFKQSVLGLPSCTLENTFSPVGFKHTFEMCIHVVVMASSNYSRLVGCTSRIRMSLFLTFQKWTMGLWFGDYGVHFNIENSLVHSMNKSATIFDTWHGEFPW